MSIDKLHKYSPECPFCGRNLARPVNLKTEFGEILSGSCPCGAVYVCDPTGHNAGEAYMEALALVKGDWQIGLLDPDADYKIIDMDYDLKTHTRVHSGRRGGEISGKLIFVKLESSKTSALPKIVPPEKQPDRERGGMRLKKSIKGYLERGTLDEIVKMSQQDNAVVRALISMAYDKESVTTWRAIEALGLVAGQFTGGRVGVIRETIRRLIWSMTDESGAIGWSAPEMLGEIIRNNPDEYQDIVPIVWSFREEELFRGSALWAMGRIAEMRPDLVTFIREELPHLLRDADPVVRGYAAWVMGILDGPEAAGKLKALVKDNAAIPFYHNGELRQRRVGEFAEEAMDKNTK